MPIQGPIDREAIARRQADRQALSPETFTAIQRALIQAGHLDDPCRQCGCRRRHHLPKPTFSYAKSGGSSGKSVELPVLAATSCDCPYCICSCVEFQEPEYGQEHWQCIYEPGRADGLTG